MKTVHVYVTPKQGVLDPQGKAIAKALTLKGYEDIAEIRLGKFIEIKLEDASNERIKEICDKLLANTVIEDYRFEVLES